MVSGWVGALRETGLASHAVESTLHAVDRSSGREFLGKCVSAVGLYRLSPLVERQQFLQVGLQHSQAGIDDGRPESVRQQAEVGEAGVGIVGVHRFDVAGSSHCVQHGLHLRHNQPARDEHPFLMSHNSKGGGEIWTKMQ